MRDVDTFAALMGSATRAHVAATAAEEREQLDRARDLASQLLRKVDPVELVVAVARAGTALTAEGLKRMNLDARDFSFNTEARIFLDPSEPPA